MKQIQAEEQDIKIYTPVRHRPDDRLQSGQNLPETDEVLSLWEPSRSTARKDGACSAG